MGRRRRVKKENKNKKMLKDIILMSLVLIAAMVCVMTVFLLAMYNLKVFVAFVISAAFLVLFGRVNAW